MISGSELAKEFLQIRPDMPIILCTGYSAFIDEIKAQEIGITAFVMKPVHIRDISRLIRKVLDGEESAKINPQ
jgi:DNA-binding NtrC family response regulator